MAKKTRKRKKSVDHIPKCWQQPRSPGGPRRRTNFSFFFFSSLSPCSSSLSCDPLGKGALLESLSSKSKLTSASTTGLEEMRDKRTEIVDFPLTLAQCSNSVGKIRGLPSNVIEISLKEVESTAENELLNGCHRNVVKQNCDVVRKLELNPDESHITDSSTISVTPGSVVWAKTTCQLWWPAEILGERSTVVDSEDQGVDGHVLIQYFGNFVSAWVDPARDLSQFDECFEERSCNPVQEFQDALKQALHQRRHCVGKQFIESCDDFTCGSQRDQSPEKGNSSSSSRIEIDCQERRRGQRERKPNLRFDEVIFPVKSVKKVRRLRIMRFLGLAAPIGSPFHQLPNNCFHTV